MAGLLVTECATIGLAIWKREYMPYFEEPCTLQVVFMAMGFILLIYSLPLDSFLEKHAGLIESMAKCSLGVYIIHEYVRTVYQKTAFFGYLKSLNLLVSNFIICATSVVISFLIVYLFIKIVPQRISKYFM